MPESESAALWPSYGVPIGRSDPIPNQIFITVSVLPRLCDVSVTGAWGRIDNSVTAGGLRGGARCMQPSIAAE